MQDLLNLIETGHGIRYENVRIHVQKWIKPESLKTVIQIIHELGLPIDTPKKAAKSILVVALAGGYLTQFNAKLLAKELNHSWIYWNIMEGRM